MLLVTVLFLLASFLKIVSGSDWCYQSQVTCNHTCAGPETWGLVSRHCSGRSQSPVNIVTRRALPDERLTSLHLTGYQETFHSHFINTGHSVKLDLPWSIRIKEGNLSGTYKAIQLHLHWGKDGGPGSEHLIDGEQFPMEMHIVHIKEKYDSLSEAATDRTGVAALGFFFQESEFANKKFDPIIRALKYIQQHKNSTTLREVSLDMFTLPQKNMTKYFRYEGSLTTPGCAEAVVWTVFEDTIPLSRKQLAAFSQLQFSDGKQMVRTFRSVQPLNERQVYYSRGHVAAVSTVLLMLAALVPSALSLHTTA
ncbi:carbonic anhydrase 4b [Hippoglossus stenolepis]|uniref:carbonic anhydrase 4b n=1 Tax=Hippoglossus stenolepis TaxID=195615 RepID=UPI001FAF8E59|nr:carbonic anhydrase 4b [Hippoglossus stenolepis]